PKASHRRCQAPHRQCDTWGRPAVGVVGVRSAQNGVTHSLPVADVSFQTHRILGENLVLDREACAHVRNGAISLRWRAREKRKTRLQIVILTLALFFFDSRYR